jgi:hypothetical protein
MNSHKVKDLPHCLFLQFYHGRCGSDPFRAESAIPPTLAGELGLRLTYISEIDISSPPLHRQLLGGTQSVDLADQPGERIAVIGMACQLRGSEDTGGFWQILKQGQSQHREVPEQGFGMTTAWRKANNRK